jgi:predicted lipid-binding transport protein (Tim44 family)
MGGAAGGLLSTLLMIVLMVMVVSFLARLFRRKAGPADPGLTAFHQQPLPAGPVPMPMPDYRPPLNGSGWQGGFNQPSAIPLDKGALPHTPWGVPAGFDTDAFLRHAKASFIRLQAAWDRGDLADLREFTSPEVYAELQLQIQERGGQPDYTEVVSIDAQLLGIETTERDYLASVQFNGMIRNAPGAAPEPYVEVWNLAKPLNGNGGWVLAGVQQIT